TRTISLRRAGSNKVETYQVKIPKGVHEGQRIRLAGQGEAGARGGKSGDLFLRVRLAKHPDFSVEGSDLIHEVKIAPWQAALGTELKVPTLEGNVKLKIPPGTQGGQRFRLRERGLPSASGKRGDLYVAAQILIPKKLTEREREIWGQLAKLHGSKLCHSDRRGGISRYFCARFDEIGNSKRCLNSTRQYKKMKIALGTDHAGFRYKEKVKELLTSLGHEVKDFGTFSEEAVDYPLFIRPAA